MLAGLLFATHEAEDGAGRMVATLPLAGGTLIEHQARQLVEAGASQVVVIAQRLTPELLGALSRIGRKVAIDAVRTAGEAAEKLHPLARVLMVADGLVTTDAAVAVLAGEGGDALLTLPDRGTPGRFERVGGQQLWAGIARLLPARIAEVAALPRDYDAQSSLLRVADQAGAQYVGLPDEATRHGHGIALDAAAASDRGRRVVAAFFAGARNWFDRYVVAPVAGWSMPALVARAVPDAAITGLSAGAGLLGLAAIGERWVVTGLALVLLGSLGLLVGSAVAALRGEGGKRMPASVANAILPVLAAAVIGVTFHSDGAVPVLAATLLLIGALGERAVIRREVWWGSPPAYLLVVLVFALLNHGAAGLGAAALYAAATTAAATERLRRTALASL